MIELGIREMEPALEILSRGRAVQLLGTPVIYSGGETS